MAIDPQPCVDEPIQVEVGDVTVTIEAEHEEDTPHVSGDIGSFALAVRNDDDIVVTSDDGDYSPISVDSRGRVKVTLDGEQIILPGLEALLAGTLTVDTGLTEFPLPAGQVTTLTQRALASATDAVQAVDAAETVGLLRAAFDFTAAGAGQEIVAAPGAGSLLRLRRISPTYAIRSPDSEPILILKVGSEISQHGNTLVGRFDDTATADTDAITLDVDVLDAGGHVTGTVYYEEIAP